MLSAFSTSLRQRGDAGCVSESSGGKFLPSVVEAEEGMTEGGRVDPESDKRAIRERQEC
jgi:hypothetical protein